MSREIAAARMNLPLTPTKAQQILSLHAEGWALWEVSFMTGIPREICARLLYVPAEWPKLVTRIEPDGTANLVRSE